MEEDTVVLQPPTCPLLTGQLALYFILLFFSDSRVPLSLNQQAERSYERAKAIADAYGEVPNF